MAEHVKSLYTTQGANHLYHHDNTLALSAEDGSYRYAGGDYKVAESHKTEYATISDIIKFEVDPDTTVNTKGYYRYYLAYAETKTYYDSMQKAVAQAVTDGYVETDSVNNYVCFGSDAEECPHSNLYRIIGVYGNNVKLIKADYATEDELGTDGDFYQTFTTKEDFNNDIYGFSNISYMPSKSKNSKYSLYYWNKVNYAATNTKYGVYNVWSESELNKTNLNKNYLNNLGTNWTNKIAPTTWNVGGMPSAQGVQANAKAAYDYELGTNKITTEPHTPYEAKVGLMYLSEYYYSALPNYWSFPGYDNNQNCIDNECMLLAGTDYSQAVNENWMYMGDYEWTISRQAADLNGAFYVDYSGGAGSNFVDNIFLVRPSFSLESLVSYAGGTGSASDPMRIK